MFVMIRHALIREEALATVKDRYQTHVMEPVVTAPGNRLFCVLNHPEREREVRQITGWDSREDCDHYLNEVLPPVLSEWKGTFERDTQTSFWDIKWPGKLQLDPQRAPDTPIYVRTSRFKLKPEGVPAVRAAYDEGVMGPAISAPGNRFFFVLLSADEERVASQVSGWDSRAACDDWLTNVWPIGYQEIQWVFEEQPTATFWELNWPLRIQF